MLTLWQYYFKAAIYKIIPASDLHCMKIKTNLDHLQMLRILNLHWVNNDIVALNIIIA